MPNDKCVENYGTRRASRRVKEFIRTFDSIFSKVNHAIKSYIFWNLDRIYNRPAAQCALISKT